MGYCGDEQIIGLVNVKRYLEENHYYYFYYRQNKHSMNRHLVIGRLGCYFWNEWSRAYFTFVELVIFLCYAIVGYHGMMSMVFHIKVDVYIHTHLHMLLCVVYDVVDVTGPSAHHERINRL